MLTSHLSSLPRALPHFRSLSALLVILNPCAITLYSSTRKQIGGSRLEFVRLTNRAGLGKQICLALGFGTRPGWGRMIPRNIKRGEIVLPEGLAVKQIRLSSWVLRAKRKRAGLCPALCISPQLGDEEFRALEPGFGGG